MVLADSGGEVVRWWFRPRKDREEWGCFGSALNREKFIKSVAYCPLLIARLVEIGWSRSKRATQSRALIPGLESDISRDL